MSPDMCIGANSPTEDDLADEWEDQRPAAWHAVFEEMSRRNPSFHHKANKGMECALIELRRLYEIESRYALVMLRNGDASSLDGGALK